MAEKSGEGSPKDDKKLDETRAKVEAGMYVPPFRLAQLRQRTKDKSSREYQQQAWLALGKSIKGLINKVNIDNIRNIVKELLEENIIRGRGLFCRSLMQAQTASPAFSAVYAALVAAINPSMPRIGLLLCNRVVDEFKKNFRRNDKRRCIAAVRLIAHLINQMVMDELIAIEVSILLLETPTADSIEVCVGFLKEVGATLSERSKEGTMAVFDRLRAILTEGQVSARSQYLVEELMAVRKSGFADFVPVVPDLELVDSDDQITHEVSLQDEDVDLEPDTNRFVEDPDFLDNEKKYSRIRAQLLGEEPSSDEDAEDNGEDGESGSDDEEEDWQEPAVVAEQQATIDRTEQDLVAFRRTMYLTIMSSVDFEECAHKILMAEVPDGWEKEVSVMIIECCSQERTYLRFYGLLGQRFCNISRSYQEAFDECFLDQYSIIHRLETNKLRNIAKFFAHLMHTDGLPWSVLGYIKLNEAETTASSRIFIKILFQELAEYLGLVKLREKLQDKYMTEHFVGLFPEDNPRNMRFAINFFTSIGLGGLTDELRQRLKDAPQIEATKALSDDESSSSGSETSSSSGYSSSSSSSSGSSSGSYDSDSDSTSSSSSDSSSEDEKERRRSISKRRRSPASSVRENKRLRRGPSAESFRARDVEQRAEKYDRRSERHGDMHEGRSERHGYGRNERHDGRHDRRSERRHDGRSHRPADGGDKHSERLGDRDDGRRERAASGRVGMSDNPHGSSRREHRHRGDDRTKTHDRGGRSQERRHSREDRLPRAPNSDGDG